MILVNSVHLETFSNTHIHALFMIGRLLHHRIHLFTADDVMPVLDIQNKMATCSSLESEIDAQYCLTVTTTTGRLNKHCHSGSARGNVHNAREVGCTVTQHANGSSSVITNQHSKSLTNEPTAGGWVGAVNDKQGEGQVGGVEGLQGEVAGKSTLASSMHSRTQCRPNRNLKIIYTYEQLL